MSRQLARERYVELCRLANTTGKFIDYMVARTFLDGIRSFVDGLDVDLFDFCCAGDEAAAEDGIESSTYGLANETNEERLARLARPKTNVE